jgi:hypothetical protein
MKGGIFVQDIFIVWEYSRHRLPACSVVGVVQGTVEEASVIVDRLNAKDLLREVGRPLRFWKEEATVLTVGTVRQVEGE